MINLPEHTHTRNLLDAFDFPKQAKPTVLTDIHLEWHPEYLTHMQIIGEFPDGRQELLGFFIDQEKPKWVIAAERQDPKAFEDYDYEDWYNDALSQVHAKGYILEGEQE